MDFIKYQINVFPVYLIALNAQPALLANNASLDISNKAICASQKAAKIQFVLYVHKIFKTASPVKQVIIIILVFALFRFKQINKNPTINILILS